MEFVGNCLKIGYSAVASHNFSTNAFVSIIKGGIFCRTVIWPCLVPLGIYQYMRVKDQDAYALEILAQKSGVSLDQWQDSSLPGIRGHWRIQKDLAVIHDAVNVEKLPAPQ